MTQVRIHLAYREALHPRDRIGRFRAIANHIEDALSNLNDPGGHYGKAGAAIQRAQKETTVGARYDEGRVLRSALRDAAAAHRAQDPAAVERHLTHALRATHAAIDTAGSDLTKVKLTGTRTVTNPSIRLRKPKPVALPEPPAGVSTTLKTVRRYGGTTTRHHAFLPSGLRIGMVHEDDPTHFTVLIPTRVGGSEQHTYPTLVEALHALEHAYSHGGPPRKRIRKEAHV